MNKDFYTIEEAAKITGIRLESLMNIASRDMIKAYRLDGQIVIPSSEIDPYRPIAVAFGSLDPVPPDEEIVEMIRAGRRPFVWPAEPKDE